MVPFTLASAVFIVAHGQGDEHSMLQLPIMAADQDECRCPGYYEAQCVAEAAQGCVWSSQGASNGPWCQCLGEVIVVPVHPVTLPPPVIPVDPVTLPPLNPVTLPPVVPVDPVTLPPLPAAGQLPASGFYRIQQKDGLNYVDAHTSGSDFDVVSRTMQDNPSQWWYLNAVGELTDQVYEIQQVGTNEGTANGRFLDGHTGADNDYRVVTRGEQGNDSQEWHFTGVDTNTFTINHAVNMRFLDAHIGSNDGSLVTRTEQGNDSQKWLLTPISPEEEQQARDLMGLS